MNSVRDIGPRFVKHGRKSFVEVSSHEIVRKLTMTSCHFEDSKTTSSVCMNTRGEGGGGLIYFL